MNRPSIFGGPPRLLPRRASVTASEAMLDGEELGPWSASWSASWESVEVDDKFQIVPGGDTPCEEPPCP